MRRHPGACPGQHLGRFTGFVLALTSGRRLSAWIKEGTVGLAYVILGHAAQVTAFLGHTGLRFLSRLLGLLLAVIAVQFILQGVEETVLRLAHQFR